MTPAEERVWRAFGRGADVDLREPADGDPARGADWGPERTLRAAVVRALLLSAPQEDGETAALRLAGARITGTLNSTPTSATPCASATASSRKCPCCTRRGCAS